MAGQESQRFELIDALADEFAARYRRGEHPSLEEYVHRYPALADDIRELLPALVHVEQVKEDLVAGPDSTLPSLLALDQIGDFRILREVGKGGMGIVYEAEQISLARRVALKLLPKKLLPDAKAKERFRREAKTAAKLHHTNIVPVFGVGEHEDMPYFVMQFIQGLGLDDVLDELKRIQGNGGPSPTSLRQKQLVATPKELSAADAAQSLLTGVFHLPDAVTETAGADAGQRAQEDRPEVNGDGRGSIRLTSSPSSSLVAETAPRESSSHALEPAAGNSSSVSLPGQNGTAAARGRSFNYWHSVARIGLQVADALEYAHRQGILHRDIKPSNLLLDGRGTVWVTDFGLAKDDQQQNLTDTGDILGTLRYMPPEAFDGKTDSRSDVYALGLTLYELLALRPAFGEDERRKLIKQVTGTEPARLDKVNRSIPRDLATIVHKATEREPSHRYQTASDVAVDLQRFLDDEPIRARRHNASERAWRWCRRNPAVAALLAAVFVLLATVAGVTSLAAFHYDAARLQEQDLRQAAETAFAQEQEERRKADTARLQAVAAQQSETSQRQKAEEARAAAETARQNEAEQGKLADAARAEAEHRKQQADASFRLAQAAVDDYLTRVSESRLFSVPGMQPLRKDLLQSALQYYLEFVKERANDPALRKDLAFAYLRMAKITADIGSPTEALAHCDKARQVLEELTAHEPMGNEVRLNLVACQQLAGALHLRMGKLEPALSACQQAYRILLEVSPQDLRPLGRVRRISGAGAGAVPLHVSNDPDILIRFFSVLNDTGTVYRQMGELGATLYWYDQALLIQQSLVAKHPWHRCIVLFKHGLAGQWDRQGRLQADIGMNTEARACHQAAQTVLAALLRDHPRDEKAADFQRDLAASREHEGDVLARAGKLDAAWDCCAAALPLRQQLARENPAVTDNQADLARCHFQMAVLKQRANQPEAALLSLEQAIDRQRLLFVSMPDIKSYARELSHQLGCQGAVLRQAGQLAKAAASYREARTILEKLPPLDPGDFYELALWRAASEGADGKSSAALDSLRQAVKTGYRDLDRLEKDDELTPLRARPEFQKLVEEVRAQTKTLRWFKDLDAARAAAATAEHKDLFLWIGGSDWALQDAITRKTRFERPEFIDYANKHFVLVDLDAPQYKPATTDLATRRTLTARWSFSGAPHGVLADAQGRPYAHLSLDRDGTRSMHGFLKQIEGQREAHARRDELLTLAASSQGLAKARLLDKALSTMPACFRLDYADVIAAICSLDRDNQAGLRSRYESLDWSVSQQSTPEHRNLCEKLLAVDPTNSRLRVDLAMNFFYVGLKQHQARKLTEARRSLQRAVALLEETVKENPQTSPYRINLARSLRSLGEVESKTGENAVALQDWLRSKDLFTAVAKVNQGAPALNHELAELQRKIGHAYGRAGLWQDAESTLDAACAIEPRNDDGSTWFARAALAVQQGKLDRYREICEEFARLPTNATQRHWITRLNMLAPNAYRNPNLATQAAQTEFAHADIPWYQFVLGAAHYRAGKYAEAERVILASMVPKAKADYLSYRWFWLAMACQRQGKTEDAKRWLQKGIQWQEKNAPQERPGGGPDNVLWQQRLELRILRREAESLVQAKSEP